ncbi:MAG: helix-turn-helix domain-containing protein [Proteobacteria bacterium]|nr:MAG: helix-turn-helix domain-containing protein [Pseudomonadota bacterium]
MKSKKNKNPVGRPPFEMKLSKEDRLFLRRMLKKGEISVRVLKRARTLQMFDEGKTAPECAESLGMGRETTRRIAKRYDEGGLEFALYELERAKAGPLLDAKQETKIVAMICSKAPEGYARWSLRLIVKEAIDREICETVSEETIRRLLHRHELKPWREKNVVRGKA